MPRPPLRRSRLKARIAAAYVLEQALRAASSALALGEGDMASCAARQTLVGTRPGIFRVNLKAFQVYPVLPGVGLMSSKFMAPDHEGLSPSPAPCGG